jgi:hypothetical protein
VTEGELHSHAGQKVLFYQCHDGFASVRSRGLPTGTFLGSGGRLLCRSRVPRQAKWQDRRIIQVQGGLILSNRAKALVALVGCSFIAAITLSYAATKTPNEDVVISSARVFTIPLAFSHSKHKEYKCTECHHEYESNQDFVNGKNAWQEGKEVKLCSACHPLERNDKIMHLEKAYHVKCIGCHKQMKELKEKTGPIACSKCHAGATDPGQAK